MYAESSAPPAYQWWQLMLSYRLFGLHLVYNYPMSMFIFYHALASLTILRSIVDVCPLTWGYEFTGSYNIYVIDIDIDDSTSAALVSEGVSRSA